MATKTLPPPPVGEDTIWFKSFSETDRSAQLSEDSLAWSRVTLVLLSVVAVGLLLAVGAVLISN